jgi:hypothetical protein
MQLLARITLGQIWSKLFKFFLGYCVVFTCLSWISIKFPEQVTHFIDYMNEWETGKKPVVIPKEDTEDNPLRMIKV